MFLLAGDWCCEMRTDYTLRFGERLISSVKLFEGSDKNFYQKNQAFETGPVPQGV